MKISNRGATVYWSINRRTTDKVFGYNIYLSSQSLKDKLRHWNSERPDPHNFAPYPGDTDGDRNKESYDITDLENGKSYFVSVRTLGPNGSESQPSNEVEFVPMAGGTFRISSDHSAENGGFEFDSGEYFPARNLRADLYFWSKDNRYYLSSPDRLGAGLRKTAFLETGLIGKPSRESIEIKVGDKITASNKNGRAEMIIRSIDSRGREAAATIEYIFYPRDYKSR